MTLTYEHNPGRVLAKQDGVAFFDTDSYPIQIAPAISITGQVITFPDLMKGDAYAFARGLIGTAMYRSCQSFVTLGPQEWGPANSIPPPDTGRALADVVLGTVPATVDALYVRVKLNRTTTPSQINGATIPTLFKEGEWVNCPGGSLPVEWLGVVSRQIDIVLAEDGAGNPVYNPDGTRNIVLQRRQSVKRVRYTFWRSGNDPDNSGWTYGGPAGAYGHIVRAIQSRGPDFTVGDGSDYSRTGGLHCSLVDTTDYSSVYTGDIEVYPVSTNEEPTSSTSSTKSLTFTTQDIFQKASATTAPFLFEDVLVGGPHPTRYVYFGAWMFGTPNINFTARLKDPNTGAVIVNLTEIVTEYDPSGTQRIYKIFRAALPDIVSVVNLEIVPSLSSTSCGYACFIAYNLTSPTVPVTVINTGQYGGPSWVGVAINAAPPDNLALFFASRAGVSSAVPNGSNEVLGLTLGVDDPADILIESAGNSGGQQQPGTSRPATSPFRLRWMADLDYSGSTNFESPIGRCLGLVLT